MKDISEFINEGWGEGNIPSGSDYLCINIFDEEYEFYSSKKDKIINDTPELKKMKYGDIYRDNDDLLWVCYKDTENLMDNI